MRRDPRGLWLGPAAVLLAASLAHAGDPCDAPEARPVLTIAAGVADANSDTETPGRPAVAAGVAGWLATTCMPTGLTGVVVSPAGEVAATVPLGPGSCGSGARLTDVAFASGTYLVVTERGGTLRAVRVTSSGAVLDGGEGIGIADGPSDYGPAVAAGSDRYLVVWQRYDGITLQEVYGAVVTPDGQATAPFPIVAAEGEQAFPAVACGATSCLVAWRDTRSGSGPSPASDIVGTRVTLDGTVLDPGGIAISSAAGGQADPAVAFDGTRYLVVWVDGAEPQFPSPTRLAGALVDADGHVVQRDIDIATGPGQKSSPRVAFDGARHWVTWWVNGYRGQTPVGIGLARVSPDGALVDGPASADGLRVAQPECDTCRLVHPNLAFGGGTALLAWANNFETSGTQKSVEGRLIRARAGSDPCWSLAGTTVLRATASGNGATCTAACRVPSSEALVFEGADRYRIPASVDGLACPLGGVAQVPDEVGRRRGRGRVVLQPDNLAEIKRALAACFGNRARVGSYHTWLRPDADGIRLKGRTTATSTYRAQVPTTVGIVTRFAGALHGSGETAVAPLTPRQARLPLCSPDLRAHCARN